MSDGMKKIWVLEFIDGTAEVYHEPQSAPAWPYVCEFDVKREIAALRERVALLENAMLNIEEYWNRDENAGAMSDACWHAIETARAAVDGNQP